MAALARDLVIRADAVDFAKGAAAEAVRALQCELEGQLERLKDAMLIMSREHEAELRALESAAAARVSDLEAAVASAHAQAAAAAATAAERDREEKEGRTASLRRITELQLAVEVGDRAMGDLRSNAGQVASRLQQVSVDGCVNVSAWPLKVC